MNILGKDTRLACIDVGTVAIDNIDLDMLKRQKAELVSRLWGPLPVVELDNDPDILWGIVRLLDAIQDAMEG